VLLASITRSVIKILLSLVKTFTILRATMKRKSSQQILGELEGQSDDLPMRSIGIWTLEKLAILLLYFQGFTNASTRAGGGVYIDGLAGPGLCAVRGAQAPLKIVWGSPLIALRTNPRFNRCVFIELDHGKASALVERTKDYRARCSVKQGSVNVELTQILRTEVPGRAPCFCLLDPEGTELWWSTVEAVARTTGRDRKPELLILFPSASLMRLLPRKGEVN
jgi:three-Cys-motif partner protein